MHFGAAFAFLGLASMVCAYSDHRVASLIGDVTAGNYGGAVQTAFELESEYRDDLIKEAIDGLFENNVRNLFDFAYRLNRDGGFMIVRESFPVEVERILDERFMKLMNRQDNLALKLASTVDEGGDRMAYGDGAGYITRNIAWKFTPLWENNGLYFYIFGVERNQYLKLAYSPDSAGDHTAYGGDSPTDNRYRWYLVPARIQGRNLYYIVNKEFNQPLKLGRALDWAHDRVAYGHNGDFHGNPEQFGWYITEY
ncbi:microvitellogenin [Bombyx mori]|uniref:Microvitellogenin-like n=1 Tax=Bombyx mori TaxID=7091 RepID=A0A8R2C8Y7_BOMMO|nr:microvitellogenin [Bombyx mori]